MRSHFPCGVVAAIAFSAFPFFPSTAVAAVIEVPGTVANIKAAVALAADGDEIVIGSGTWSGASNRDVHLQGKQLWIHSANGAASCTINGQGLGRGFILDGGEPAGTVIEGLTFKDCRCLGFTTMGGAILVPASATLAVVDCVFLNNITDLNGRGGAIASAGTLAVTGSSFTGNTAYYYGGRGGAIYTTGSADIADCVFQANVGSEASGGAIASEGTTSVIDCTFDGNLGGSGGALWCGGGACAFHSCDFTATPASAAFSGGIGSLAGGATTFESCTFVGGASGPIYGGGAFIVVNPAVGSFLNCRFIGNKSGGQGGGSILETGGSVEATNCIFTGCSAYLGGAIRVTGGVMTLHACTLAQNKATSAGSTGGGGILTASPGVVTLDNCVLWLNTAAGATGQMAQIQVSSGTAIVDYCCVEGLDGSLGGTGNLDDDPLLANPLGPDGIPGTLDDDLRLRVGSPCIDAGESALLPIGTVTDLDGGPRIVDGDLDGVASLDLGAYENANPADLNGDGAVDGADLGILLGAWGGGGPGDLNGDGTVDGADLGLLLAVWN